MNAKFVEKCNAYQFPSYISPFYFKYFIGKTNFRFTLHTSFVGHMATVHGNVKYLCAECGRSFQTKTNLTMHMLTHDPAEKHKVTCSKCGLM